MTDEEKKREQARKRQQTRRDKLKRLKTSEVRGIIAPDHLHQPIKDAAAKVIAEQTE
jgi:hypothetical protein